MNISWRKPILILASIVCILSLTMAIPALRSPGIMQIFFQEISIGLILAIALSFVFISGSVDFSLGGFFLLALALVRLWRKSDMALEAGLAVQIFVALLIPIGLAILAGAVGWVISMRHRYSALLSIAFAILLGALGLLLMPDFGPWCEPWFCAEVILPPGWIILPSILAGIVVSIGTVYYFFPDFHWIRPLAATWLMIGLGSFVVVEYQGLPLVVLVSIIILIAGEFFLNQARWGLRFRAVGSNFRAARLSGIPVQKTRVFAYGLLGLCVGAAALFEIDLVASDDIQSVYFRQVDAFVAMLLGGVAYAGGRGSLSSVASAVLLITSLNQLEWAGVSSLYLLIGKAALILVIILLGPKLASLFKSAKSH